MAAAAPLAGMPSGRSQPAGWQAGASARCTPAGPRRAISRDAGKLELQVAVEPALQPKHRRRARLAHRAAAHSPLQGTPPAPNWRAGTSTAAAPAGLRRATSTAAGKLELRQKMRPAFSIKPRRRASALPSPPRFRPRCQRPAEGGSFNSSTPAGPHRGISRDAGKLGEELQRAPHFSWALAACQAGAPRCHPQPASSPPPAASCKAAWVSGWRSQPARMHGDMQRASWEKQLIQPRRPSAGRQQRAQLDHPASPHWKAAGRPHHCCAPSPSLR